jgi:hypothetical protein
VVPHIDENTRPITKSPRYVFGEDIDTKMTDEPQIEPSDFSISTEKEAGENKV